MKLKIYSSLDAFLQTILGICRRVHHSYKNNLVQFSKTVKIRFKFESLKIAERIESLNVSYCYVC